MNRLLYWVSAPFIFMMLVCVLIIHGEDEAGRVDDSIHEFFGLE